MDFTILILVLPLLSFLVLGLAGTKLKPGAAGAIGTVVLGAVTVLSYLTAILYFGAGRNAEGIFPTLMPYNAVWLPISQTLHIDMGILLDPISVMMLVVISTVSLMVHIYSFGYMKGERGFQRYYAFLSLFTMSMLGLVVATNIFQMYLFWELVGVSSYLLIGFYYTKPEAIAASKKAFIVTRFADLGFLIGILFYGYYAGTFSFTPDAQLLAAAGTMIPLALGLMFIGGAGKSAMFPLHIWLPDAMEGPTPVSALIHAATMVVAGVYLVARMFPLYIGYAPDVLHWVAYIGAFTALYAAVVARGQSDIKRVLAFSTISQIGFMLVALGVCTTSDPHTGGLGYMASMFHLFTHAMFKALLFLCAGCIIHAVHSNEMSAMGGMRKYMPVTHITFLVACLAIAGIWPLSGFFSKDEILTACFAFSPLMGWVMTGIAGLTAFYMFRLYYGIFWGKENKELHAHHTPHEAPATMTVPLVVLAVITCVAGFIPFGDFISSDGEAYTIHLDGGVVAISLTVAKRAAASPSAGGRSKIRARSWPSRPLPAIVCGGGLALFQSVHQILEDPAPLHEVGEPVKGGAGRGQQHHIPRPRRLTGQRHGGLVAVHLRDGQAGEVGGLLHGGPDHPGGCAAEDQGFHMLVDLRADGVIGDALVLAPGASPILRA